MYEQHGLSDPFFLMLYGGAMMLALTSCCYMLVAFRSTLAAQVVPPRGLRYWTAAFYAAVAVSQSAPSLNWSCHSNADTVLIAPSVLPSDSTWALR